MRPFWAAAPLLTAGVMVLFLQAAGEAQKTRLEDDPVFGPIMEARREGRLLDAKKLVGAAIQEAEAKSPPDRRLKLLLSQLASLDAQMGLYGDAIAIAKQMLESDEKSYGSASPRLLVDLNNLGHFYQGAGNNSEAGKAFERELAIARDNQGMGLLLAIGDLSGSYAAAGRTKEAKALLSEAVEICDANPEPDFPDCSGLRLLLANAYRAEGDPGRAEDIVARGTEHSVGVIVDWYTQVSDLNTLASQYEEDGSYDLAEKTYREAIEVIEKTKYLKNPETAASAERWRLAALYEKEGRRAEAEQIYLGDLELAEKDCGPDHPGHSLNLSFAVTPLIPLYREENRLAELEPIFHRVLAIQERDLGRTSARLVPTLSALADVYRDEEKYEDAAPVYQRAIEVQEKNAGPQSPRLVVLLGNYAIVLRKLGEPAQAQSVETRATGLREKLQQR